MNDIFVDRIEIGVQIIFLVAHGVYMGGLDDEYIEYIIIVTVHIIIVTMIVTPSK